MPLWTPANIADDDQTCWYRPESLMQVADGANITQWSDSFSKVNITAAEDSTVASSGDPDQNDCPHLSADHFNRFPMAQFDGSNDSLDSAADPKGWQNIGTNNFQVFAMVAVPTANNPKSGSAAFYTVFSKASVLVNDVHEPYLRFFNSDASSTYDQTSWRIQWDCQKTTEQQFTAVDELTMVDNQPEMLMVARNKDGADDGEMWAYINGKNRSAATSKEDADLNFGGTNSQDKFKMGGTDNKNAQYLNGFIGEFVVYHNTVCTSDMVTDHRLEIEGYLMHKWGRESALSSKTGSGNHIYRYGPPTTCRTVTGKTLSTNKLSRRTVNQYTLRQPLNILDEERDL